VLFGVPRNLLKYGPYLATLRGLHFRHGARIGFNRLGKCGRSKKPGARRPCGKLIAAPDRGTDELHRHRGESADDVADDPRRGYALGRLFLRGRISGDQHDTGLRYAALYWRVHGPMSPRSCVANLISAGLVLCGHRRSAPRGERMRER
jgi:hypothetical protein